MDIENLTEERRCEEYLIRKMQNEAHGKKDIMHLPRPKQFIPINGDGIMFSDDSGVAFSKIAGLPPKPRTYGQTTQRYNLAVE